MDHKTHCLKISLFSLPSDNKCREGFRRVTWTASMWLFLASLTGISLGLGLFYYGQRDTTATYSSNFLNVIPVATFALSVVLRLEMVSIVTWAGKVKIAGAIICLGGALVIALYKGSVIRIGHHLLHRNTKRPHHNFRRGTIFLVASVASYVTRYIMQVKLLRTYPYRLWSITIMCAMASVQHAVIGLCINREPSAWSLGPNLKLVWIAVGAVVTPLTSLFVLYAVDKRGPAYPSMFNPVSLILVAVADMVFFHQDLTSGSLLGMLLGIFGLYLFLWAKNQETKSSGAPDPQVSQVTDVEETNRAEDNPGV